MAQNIQLTPTRKLLLMATVGRLVARRPEVAALAARVHVGSLTGYLARAYASSVAAATAWNAFHARLRGGAAACSCAPYAVALRGARTCDRTVCCPCCSARQLEQVLEGAGHVADAGVYGTRVVLGHRYGGTVASGCLALAGALRKATRDMRGSVEAVALLPRVYPTGGGNVTAAVNVLVVAARAPLSDIWGAEVRALGRGHGGLEAWVRTFGGYPANLFDANVDGIVEVLAGLRALRARIPRIIKNDGCKYNTGGFAYGVPDMAEPSGSAGGCGGGFDVGSEQGVGAESLAEVGRGLI